MTTFLVALALTVLLLVALVVTGHKGQRSAHYALVVLTLASLVWAVREAEVYGQGLVFEGAAESVRTIHFVFVGCVLALLPVMVVTGVRLARVEDPARRRLHAKMAYAFLVMVLVTCTLGAAMTMMAEPIAVAAG